MSQTRPRAWRGLPLGILLALVSLAQVTACGGDDGPVTSPDPFMPGLDTTSDGQVTGPFVDDDSAIADTALDTRPVDPGGDFGMRCEGNEDCDSGWCVDGPDGRICTVTCLERCPDGYGCRAVSAGGPDVSFICVPSHTTYCAPCEADTDCTSLLAPTAGHRCLPAADGGGSFCGTLCASAAECPADGECAPASGDETQRYCQPKTDETCGCSFWATATGASTTCAVENDAGRCTAGRGCSADGLDACVAATPTVERCNGEDDDCDGDIDEDFSLLGTPCDSDDADLCELGSWACGDDGAVVCAGDVEASVELCNGIDDDCDGETDESFPNEGVACDGPDVDECTDGVFVCTLDGLQCDDANNPRPEVCDGVDNDCNGATDAQDEALVLAGCALLDGVCAGATAAADRCVNGSWLPCTADDYTRTNAAYETASETRCDTLDNDCDGSIDEDFAFTQLDGAVVQGAGVACGAGECSGGLTVCNVARDGILCTLEDDAIPEVCDGRDNDCDGVVDAADDSLVAVACALDAGVCSGVTRPANLCVDGTWEACTALVYTLHDARYEAGLETQCDAADNDCDGDIDEDFAVTLPDGAVVEGVNAACGVGACDGGVTRCTPEGDATLCSTTVNVGAELCDGTDNDCDGVVDALDADLVSVDCELQGGVCSGIQKPAERCVDGTWGACESADYAAYSDRYEDGAEVSCDTADNDCDGAVDDDFALAGTDPAIVGADQACGIGVCGGGTTRCNDGGDGVFCPGDVNAGIEVCDGVDNDCDGLIDAADDDMVQVACDNQNGACGGALASPERCVMGAWQDCEEADYAAHSDRFEAGSEQRCDQQDNDCDGSIDEDFSVEVDDGSMVEGTGKSCGQGLCSGGITVCDGEEAIVCDTSILVGAEVCDGEDNNCDGLTDSEDPELQLILCDNQRGVCTGSYRPLNACVDGQWQPCEAGDYAANDIRYEATAETRCDGADNDCDNAVDEDFDLTQRDGMVVSGIGKGCGAGICSGGLTRCNDTEDAIVCPTEAMAVDEACDGADNDCDGSTDADDVSLVLTPCDVQDGVCAGATRAASLCAMGAWLACPDALYALHDTRYEAGQEATCEGADNDCDGAADEDFTLTGPDGSVVTGVNADCGAGACAGGSTRCGEDAASLRCTTALNATPEVCDTADNDCDGDVDARDDDLIVTPCENQAGVCEGAMHPPILCVAGDWVACNDVVYADASDRYEADAERRCDAADNDCDGDTDEDFAVSTLDGATVRGIDAACGAGLCAGGNTRCLADESGVFCPGETAAAPEVCDGDDNDCDGSLDAADPSMGIIACGLQAGVCAGSMRPATACIGGSWTPCAASVYADWDPRYEGESEVTCEGVDNDCSGVADEDFLLVGLDGQTVGGVGDACGTGACLGSTTQCNPGRDGIVCPGEMMAGPEVCSTADEDCDGYVDADDSDLEPPLCGVQAGVCQGAKGERSRCVTGSWIPCVDADYAAASSLFDGATERRCDGADNDCSGTADEDFSVTDSGGTSVVGQSCGVGVCADGAVVCLDATTAGCNTAGDARDERCDDLDNDCDGAVDNGCDDDGDRHCDANLQTATVLPAICPEGAGDCNDAADSIHPGAPELCDGIDQDCILGADNAVVDCAARKCEVAMDGFTQTAADGCGTAMCQTPTSESCGLYACSGGGAEGDVCAVSCTTDADCRADSHCDEANAACLRDFIDGRVCDEDTDCVAGHCGNGYCCSGGDCCAGASDCAVAAWGRPPGCDVASTCEGTRRDPACVESQCEVGPAKADDRACDDTILALRCDDGFPNQYCTGAANQSEPTCASSCASDAECVDGFHCDGTCQPDVIDGGGCDEASDCVGGRCNNSYCCDSGVCCDSAPSCPGQFSRAARCDDDANCDGSRIDATCAGSICGSTMTLDDDRPCGTETLADGCGTYLPVFCNATSGQSTPDCPTTCTADTECDDDAHCDGTCVSDLPDGERCDEASDCESSNCANGRCCVGDDCCATAGECPAFYTSNLSCDFDETCQGTVDAAVCVDFVCGTQADVPNDGACGSATEASDCGPYPAVQCNGDDMQTTPMCAGGCNSDDDCDLDAYCNAAGACVPDEDDGDTCGDDGQCISGHCANGYCCSGGTCCASALNCTDPAFSDPSVCSDASSCSGFRRNALCTANVCQLGGPTADDSGCRGELASGCGLYPSVYCNSGQSQSAPDCATECGSNGDCDSAAFCDADDLTCKPDRTAGQTCNATAECAPGLGCVDGVCCTSTCAGGCERCDLSGNGSCSTVSSGTDPDGDCGALSCAGRYHGFTGDTCYLFDNVDPGEAVCATGGICQSVAAQCAAQPRGVSSGVTCDALCQEPTAGTCMGTTLGRCTNVGAGLTTCGQGACFREVPRCDEGEVAICVPGTETDEVCDGIDNDCDGKTDGDDPDLEAAPLNSEQDGVCAGTVKRCAGAQGWVEDLPATAGQFEDPLDSGYADENCDGVDGDVATGIFVRRFASNSGSCTFAQPCGSISYAMGKQTATRFRVYIRAGTYDVNVLQLTTGIQLLGGYDSSWDRDDRSATAHRALLTNPATSTSVSSQYMTLRAINDGTASQPVRLDNLAVAGPVVPNAGQGASGRGSYTVYISGGHVRITNCDIAGGTAGNGGIGASGTNAPSTSAAPGGGRGSNGDEICLLCCSTSRKAGGVLGNNTCSGGRNPDGGTGGQGGQADRDCAVFGGNLDDSSGFGGTNASVSTASYGRGGGGGGTCRGTVGLGQTGNTTHGARGSGGSGGYLSGGYWLPRPGTNGTIGDNGTGGGGGGGAGGCDDDNDDRGAGGGGGGSGGCRARDYGDRGLGGGGSFGVFALSATVEVRNTAFVFGFGGDGGTGGNGGAGQPGGAFGSGGSKSEDTVDGGRGGYGGYGGHSGAGGGGAGGPVYGIYRSGGGLTESGNAFDRSTGDPGDGGAGGQGAINSLDGLSGGSAGYVDTTN